MNVLFFTYCYPPLKYPRSIQISRLVKYSAHQITVVCGDDRSSVKDQTITGKFFKNPHEIIRYQRKEYSSRFLRRLINRIAYPFSFPDIYRSWAIKAARKVLDTERLHGADVLVTFGNPMSDHLAGLEIKKVFGIKWVAHFSDPWADNPFHVSDSLRIKIDKHYERHVVATADMLIFTSRQTRDLVMKKYPDSWNEKARVLPHAYDPDLYSGALKNDNALIIRHLGNLFPPRFPDKMIEGLCLLHERNPAALEGIRIELIGSIGKSVRLNLLMKKLPDGLVMMKEPVKYIESLQLMVESDLLLVIDAPFDTSVFLPSKLVDYVGSGKPIFAITPPGASADLVSRYGGIVVDPINPEGIADKFEEVITELGMRKHKNMVNEDVRVTYSAKQVVDKFDELISEFNKHDKVL